MNRRTRVFLIICLAAFVSSFFIQTVFQFIGAERSVWGGNPGWQREIAFWNFGVSIVVLLTLRLNEQRAAHAACVGFTVMFLLLGTNHLVAFFSDPRAQFHWPPLVLNYVGFLFGLRTVFGPSDVGSEARPKDVA